jgi:endonuclease/exonuclease/phosphatase family metal-dependent hydrolase
MAAKTFTPEEWKKIRQTLDADPARYGLPDRVYGSVSLASFNIRKLGSTAGRNNDTWNFLADVCRRFDLLAVQEIMDDLNGLRKLQGLMGPEFGMIVSDKTGAFPGEPGVGERLGYIFNRSIVRRTEIATDISYDRSKVLDTLGRYNTEIYEAMAPYAKKLNDYLAKLDEYNADHSRTKPKPPKFKVKMPTFLTFIRTPFCVSFEISGHPGTEPYQFMAINAHLYFGDYMADRRQEFDALMEWIIARVKENDRAYYPNFILLGDLNLDFDDPRTDRERIEKHIKTFNRDTEDDVNVNFPFLDPYPGRKEVFRTNARLDQTFDQIGLFCRDQRMPTYLDNARAGQDPRGPDYGVFDFASLFSEALNNQSLDQLSPDAKSEFLARFEHKVSDHMPLWLRLPRP